MSYLKTCQSFLKKTFLIIFITFFLSLIIDFFFGKLILNSLDSFLVKTEFYGRLMRIDHPVFHHSSKLTLITKIIEVLRRNIPFVLTITALDLNAINNIKKNLILALWEILC